MQNSHLDPEERLLRLLEDTAEEKKRTQAEELVELAKSRAEFWKTPEDTEVVTLFQDDSRGGHQENWPLSSKRIRQWLAFLYYEKHGKPPGSQALQDALEMLKAEALFRGKTLQVHLRIGEVPGLDMVWLDLCNSFWEAVEISREGWRVTTPKVPFFRTKGMLPLPIPEEGGSVELLRSFLNVDDEGFVLIVAWLLTCFRERGPFPILLFEGEQGSGKSTAVKVLRSLVDPHTCPLRSAPREERDLVIAASNSWILAFDNLSGIPPWLSDALCRIATGGGFSTRKLYTDREEELFSSVRPIVANGIDEIGNRHDFLDRAIIVTLPPIPEEKRKDERTFWDAFEKARPKILGGLLNAVSCGLRNWNSVGLPCLPRMADFARWVASCEDALPWKPGTFLRVYQENRESTISQAVELDSFICAVRNLVSESGEWEGTAQELLSVLSSSAPESVKRNKAWPATPRALSNRLRRSATFLRSVGVEVGFYRKPKSRLIRLVRISESKTETCGNHGVEDGEVF